MELHTTTPDEDFDAFDSENNPQETKPKGFLFTAEQREAGRLNKLAKIAEWEKLDTRQDFADAAYLRGILSAAGARSPLRVEPATVGRLRLYLRRAKIQGPEIRETIGTDLETFLTMNPRLPLWAALALVLEMTGKYDKKAAEFADEELAQPDGGA